MDILWNGGYDIEMFQESEAVLELFHCGICLSVSRDIVETSCGHLFCEDCIHAWLHSRPICPVDRKPLDPHSEKDVYPLLSMRRKISNFNVTCPKDCGEQFHLYELQVHIETQCPNIEEISAEDFVMWKTAKDFPDEDTYAEYLKKTLKRGMMLKATSDYERVKKGDVGIFLQFNSGSPPCQVRWKNFGHKFWLPWKDLEIIEMTSKGTVTKKRDLMKDIENEKQLRRKLKKGTRVMAINTFQSISQGDTGVFMQSNEKYPPVQVQWEGYGNSYWVFWKNIILIDGMSDEEIQALRKKYRPSGNEEKTNDESDQKSQGSGSKYKSLTDFDSEVEYSFYLKKHLSEGLLVRSLRDYEQIKKGDVGSFVQWNTNYPPCQVRWKNFGHKYWLYWKDLELVEPSSSADHLYECKKELQADIEHEEDLRRRLRPGTKVLAVQPYRCVLQGDIGEYMQHNEKYPPIQVHWQGYDNSYWVFWKNIHIIDGLSDAEIEQLKAKFKPHTNALTESEGNVVNDGEGTYKKLHDFTSELEYTEYMRKTLKEGMMLRAVNPYEQIKKGDIGLYLQHNSNYPPCQIRWKKFGHKYWLYWRDLEILSDKEAELYRDDLQNDMKYEDQLRASITSGTRVMAKRSYQCIAQGDTGEYVQHNDRYPPVQVRWDGYGDSYWVFWKDIVPIDSMSVAEIQRLKQDTKPFVEEEECKSGDQPSIVDFDCESDYVAFLKDNMTEGSSVVAVKDYFPIQKGDVGTFVKSNTSYPPCQVEWKRLGKKRWVYWRDIKMM